jgi:adenylate cyclase
VTLQTGQVRNQLALNNGYEVEVEEGNFVCAFHNAVDAVDFSVQVQQRLMTVRWSPYIMGHSWAAEQRTATNELTFRGLRLAIGMCTGNAMRVQPCMRTGKMEYYGPIMNHAARVAVAAHGGQVWFFPLAINNTISLFHVFMRILPVEQRDCLIEPIQNIEKSYYYNRIIEYHTQS